MNRRAHVTSIETIREFRPALVRFADQVRQALAEVQGEVQHTAAWLEQEQGPHWQRQIRKRQEQVQEARQALNTKKLYDSADGSRKTAIEEEQTLARARRRLEEAEQKVQAVRRWRREIEREWMRQQGLLQRLNRAVEQDVPRALALLEQLSRSLEAYTALAAPQARREAEREVEAGAVMARDRGDAAEPVPEAEASGQSSAPDADATTDDPARPPEDDRSRGG